MKKKLLQRPAGYCNAFTAWFRKHTSIDLPCSMLRIKLKTAPLPGIPGVKKILFSIVMLRAG